VPVGTIGTFDCFAAAARLAALALAIWSRSARDDFLGVASSPDAEVTGLGPLDDLEGGEAGSEELFEGAVAVFFGTKPILSRSLDWSNIGIEGLRKSPFKEALGFNGRDESVLLPDKVFGRPAVDFTGLGDL
jgi:hypothetical protein